MDNLTLTLLYLAAIITLTAVLIKWLEDGGY